MSLNERDQRPEKKFKIYRPGLTEAASGTAIGILDGMTKSLGAIGEQLRELPGCKDEPPATARPAEPETHEYLFDLVLAAAIRFRGSSEADARRRLEKALECADANFGCDDRGDPITGEVSVSGADPGLPAAEVDGVPVDPGLAGESELVD